jgi:hypothetical protein
VFFCLIAAQAQYCCPEYSLGEKVESAEAPAAPLKQREKSRSPAGMTTKKTTNGNGNALWPIHSLRSHPSQTARWMGALAFVVGG